MVKIRMARTGAKKKPFYHIVVTDSRSARDGRYIERLGFYNPVARGHEQRLKIDTERADYWLGQGCRITGRADKLLREARRQAGAETAAEAPAA